MRDFLLLVLFVIGSVVSLVAVPVRFYDQRSEPMGNVKRMHSGPSPNQFRLTNMPERFEWFNNNGYCGELSLVSAGLKYGQYVSQYQVRELILGATGSQTTSQVLLGVNDDIASEALHLNYTQWNDQDTEGFLTWIKAFVLNGYPVIMGIYTNECLFYDECGGDAGDPEYDHIVPVLGILSYSPLTPPPLPSPTGPLPTYYANDSIIFSDNGLEGPVDNPINAPCLPNPSDPYQFTYTFSEIQRDRKQANKRNGQWYALSTDTNTYGIAIQGIVDGDGQTLPVTVVTNMTSSCPMNPVGSTYINYEFPQIVNGSNIKPAAMPLSLAVTVSIPDETKTYNLYLYDELSSIPDATFNGLSAAAAQTWHIPAHSGTAYVLTYPIQSDQVAAFRAVPQTAP